MGIVFMTLFASSNNPEQPRRSIVMLDGILIHTVKNLQAIILNGFSCWQYTNGGLCSTIQHLGQCIRCFFLLALPAQHSRGTPSYHETPWRPPRFAYVSSKHCTTRHALDKRGFDEEGMDLGDLSVGFRDLGEVVKVLEHSHGERGVMAFGIWGTYFEKFLKNG